MRPRASCRGTSSTVTVSSPSLGTLPFTRAPVAVSIARMPSDTATFSIRTVSRSSWYVTAGEPLAAWSGAAASNANVMRDRCHMLSSLLDAPVARQRKRTVADCAPTPQSGESVGCDDPVWGVSGTSASWRWPDEAVVAAS